jgi:hypothetical protein
MTDKTLTMSDSYNYYCKKYKKIDKKVYHNIISIMNNTIIEHLLKGEGNLFKIPYHLGTLSINRVDRFIKVKDDKPKFAVDWGKTRKFRKEGIISQDKLVYFTDNYYVGYFWNRQNCNVPGNRGYSFVSARSNGVQCKSSARNRLVEKLNEHSEYYLKFPKKVPTFVK